MIGAKERCRKVILKDADIVRTPVAALSSFLMTPPWDARRHAHEARDIAPRPVTRPLLRYLATRAAPELETSSCRTTAGRFGAREAFPRVRIDRGALGSSKAEEVSWSR